MHRSIIKIICFWNRRHLLWIVCWRYTPLLLHCLINYNQVKAELQSACLSMYSTVGKMILPTKPWWAQFSLSCARLTLWWHHCHGDPCMMKVRQATVTTHTTNHWKTSNISLCFGVFVNRDDRETAQCVAGEWEKTHLKSRSLNRPAGMWVCKWKQFSNNKCWSPGIRIKWFTLQFHEDLTTFSVALLDGYHSTVKNKTKQKSKQDCLMQ